VNKQNTKFWAFENPLKVMETSLHPARYTVWRAVSNQWLIGQIFVEDTITESSACSN
jgi:hypothetical protein